MGYHVGPNGKMTPLHSCDAQLHHCANLDLCSLLTIKCCCPGLTGSGYFMNAGPSDIVEAPDDEVQLDPKQGDS